MMSEGLNSRRGAGLNMPQPQGLYDPLNEHDNCGVGFVANIHGTPTHDIIDRGIDVLKRLLHRGATGWDPNTGDGAGLLVQLCDDFFRKISGFPLPAFGEYGVAMIFLPSDKSARAACVKLFEDAVVEEGLTVLGWRDVPHNPDAVGEVARAEMPDIAQCFVGGNGLAGDALERKLYVARKASETRAAETIAADDMYYVCSFSSRTIVYKGLMLPEQVPAFYEDLNDPNFKSAVAVVHQRYSTNTFPSWPLAQPFRYMAHNGEINTLRGNRNWMKSREKNFESELFGTDIKKITPVTNDTDSDSASLDNAVELLTLAGRDLPHSMMMLVPQAWGEKYPMGPDLRGFFEYHAGIMEPWDGPAALAMTDGRVLAAMLDRNGLRPARYSVTKDGFIVFASEAGTIDLPPEELAERGALRPGQMLLIDFEKGCFYKDAQIKKTYSRKQPYRRWVEENKIDIHGFYGAVHAVEPNYETLLQRQKLFGYTREDLQLILSDMAALGHEPTGSMGSDQALAVLSEKSQLLYWYFKQTFAQVTNPAIDPIREQLVMSLMTFIGNTDNILTEVPQHARLIKLQHPILSNEDLKRIRELTYEDFQSITLSIGFAAGGDGALLRAALDRLCGQAEEAVAGGKRIVVLSDKGLAEDEVPIPALLAVSAVNQHLLKTSHRTKVGVLVETGEAREVHQMALLLGYGASAINPYLAYETVADLALQKNLVTDLSANKAIANYTKAICKGLLKVMSKSGISTLRSYRSAQVFESIGLRSALVNEYFPGTAARVEGIGLDAIAREANARYDFANAGPNAVSKLLPSGGQYRLRQDGERHLWTPFTVATLQRATRENNPDLYKQYAAAINDQTEKQCTLRGLFSFKPTTPVSLEEVEPAENIMKRFVTGAMSFGSISREAHETLAIAMNRIGGMSNSGEGGEDSARFVPLANGDSKCSAIKQIASGRFGVTTEYLASARELQIKISQGAKPGEGGQLPGHKVNAEIAAVRHSTPGVTLISPPPHHDIYSIEDIAQLMFDLKNANPAARVSVKLVSEVGVGTVAAGVAKGHADMILIAGYDGGTGASPLSSIKHTGMPWELGLSDAQQTLVLNQLRKRVRLQADGQMKTGRDVVIAALLGAEEFGFATAPLVVEGCVMMRKCHKNTCPVGVATQDPELRKRFTGKPEYVVNFFRFIAEEVREWMAELGFRTIDEMVGRSDLLDTNKAVDFWKSQGLDFSRIFYRAEAEPDDVRKTVEQDHGIEKQLDWEILQQLGDAIETGRPTTLDVPICNVNRTVGTIVSGRIAKVHGGKGLPDDTIRLNFKGTSGQSFGVFGMKGLTLMLEGEGNDYVGKGLSGAKIIIKPPQSATFKAEDNIIAGNVILYGATAGEVYLNGQAGERFCIRNSGAKAVVEAIGDHGCEYMTGGRVVVLGSTGVNFGAGMSGGIAYVYDETGLFDAHCNLEMIDLECVELTADVAELKQLIENHYQYTGSAKARAILDNWEDELLKFVKVFPMEYRRVLGQMSQEDEATEREEVVND